ncbi:OmpH family outer membrane protein [Thermophagus xiamenensis]|uniref:Periplasmic chaperone for outer membrane proteins Skp n=1 Tax=Thermophagus xiamenensis TaxID=385682 RepID=A0A1I2FZN7_9BACT|nr:OmpH family outer membrane protein [Thermophagus xiamenensis]SFF09891.1 periplasmic chaperone for outer membrane proteins Skp [Thermophagus xiamenensis]
MKNISIVLNAILLIAVATLFFIVLSDDKKSSQDANIDGSGVQDGAFPIAYINTDSLLISYEYAQFLNEELLKQEESSRADFNERARIFQDDMRAFQRKIQNNAFLSLERAQKEEQRLREQEQKLKELNNKLSAELMEKQNKMNRELRDTITNFLQEYAQAKSLKLVLSNTLGDNILYAEKVLDITDEVVSILNERYQKSKKSSED